VTKVLSWTVILSRQKQLMCYVPHVCKPKEVQVHQMSDVLHMHSFANSRFLAISDLQCMC